MISRRNLILSAMVIPMAGVAFAEDAAKAGGPPPPAVNAVVMAAVAVTQVFGDGQRLVAVSLAFDRPIVAASVTAEAFSVEGRTITRAYAARTADPVAEGRDGNFVIVELSPDDANAPLKTSEGRVTTRLSTQVSVKLITGLKAVEGTDVLPMAAALEATVIRNLIVDDFRQGMFEDVETGLALAYNLYVPADYDASKSYPLVLFMHDASVTGPLPQDTLTQGLGAVAFASPADQAKHPAFVLAPQYEVAIANDESKTTAHLDATINLVKSLTAEYKLDAKRIYSTGQSGGGMTAIAMNIKYPEFFAASLLVACQWDATLCAPLATKKLWVVVAEGDTKAFPGQNAIMEVVEATGTKVERAVWDGRGTPEYFAAEVAALEAKGAQINYTAFAKDSVVLPGQTGGAVDHMGTWRIAYGIDGLRDWLLRQGA